MAQRFFAGACLYEAVTERLENGLEREQIGGNIVDEQDARPRFRKIALDRSILVICY
jgi:hypothetical protein